MTSTTPNADRLTQIEETVKQWDPKSRAEAMRQLSAMDKQVIRVWYCTRGRKCDGLPHDEYTWNHARGDQWPPVGKDWFVWACLAGRGWGKELALDTPVPTPTGWTTMGDLVPGDWVLDEAGAPTTVLAAHQVETPDRAYLIIFSDGTQIHAGGEHQWVTWSHLERKRHFRAGGVDFPADWANRAPVRTTDELYGTASHGIRGDRNHCIPLAGELDLPAVDLPIEPYLFGYWLGDGMVTGSAMAVGEEDLAHVTTMLDTRGYEHGRRSDRNVMSVRGLRTQLRAAGVLGEKRIPAAYLRASVDQRLALLQGLMDSDGYAERSKVEFTSIRPELASQVLELVRSLSEKPRLYIGRATLNGRDVGPKYRVVWRPSRFTPFRLARKAQRVSFGGAQRLRNRHRMIVSIQPIEPEPMRCITVDSPNSMYLAGEGMIPTHNTRTGAEYARKMSEQVGRMALVAPTAQDARDTMIEGESGLVAVCEGAGMKIQYEPAKKRVTFPSGCRATLFSGEEPNRLRGPQHGFAWLDEPAHMPLIDDVWSNLLFGLRLPPRPHVMVTTTPTPRKWVKELVKDPRTVHVRGRTHANLINLAEEYRNIIKGYEGTRQGRQELEGEILEDVEGALWATDMLQYSEIPNGEIPRIGIAIDPAGTANRRSDITGIVAAGIIPGATRDKDIGHVLADVSGRYSPAQWAKAAIKLYDDLKADFIVVEVNFGADMVADNLRNYGFRGRIIDARAMRGKQLRAEPIVGLYEQKRIFHRLGVLAELENEMLTWIPGEGDSPNRVDAVVWVLTELLKPGGETHIASPRGLTQLGQVSPLRQRMENPIARLRRERLGK